MNMTDTVTGYSLEFLVYLQTAWIIITRNIAMGWRSYQHYMEKYPFIASVILVGAVISSVPLLLFAAFIVSTVFFTLLGFMLLEGTILIVAVMLLCGVLFVACILTLGFGTTVAVSWIVLNKVYSLLNPMPENTEGFLISKEKASFCNQNDLIRDESFVSSSTSESLTSLSKESN